MHVKAWVETFRSIKVVMSFHMTIQYIGQASPLLWSPNRLGPTVGGQSLPHSLFFNFPNTHTHTHAHTHTHTHTHTHAHTHTLSLSLSLSLTGEPLSRETRQYRSELFCLKSINFYCDIFNLCRPHLLRVRGSPLML